MTMTGLTGMVHYREGRKGWDKMKKRREKERTILAW